MPRKKAAATYSVTCGMVTARFRRKGIVEGIQAQVNRQKMTPDRIARAIGLNVTPVSIAGVEAEMDKRIKSGAIQAQKTVGVGHAGGRLVQYDNLQRSQKPASPVPDIGMKTWVDPSIRQRKQRRRSA
ncbi:MAG: hypothetical protein ACFB0G_11410 [Leptolyngbyaceae cyanobacterium]